MSVEHAGERVAPLSREEVDRIVYLLEHDIPVEEIAQHFNVEPWVIQALTRLCD